MSFEKHRVAHDGQMSRPLQLKAIKKPWLQAEP